MSLFDTSTTVFPNNVVDVIVPRIKMLYPELLVVKRPLKQSDLNQSVGVFPSVWTPDEQSYEFRSNQPTLSRYVVKLQAFAKHTVEETGIAIHSVMAKAMRTMLYNDVPLNVGLNTLSVTMFGVTEKIQRRGIQRQQFINNDVGGQFLFLSTLEYWIETETK